MGKVFMRVCVSVIMGFPTLVLLLLLLLCGQPGQGSEVNQGAQEFDSSEGVGAEFLEAGRTRRAAPDVSSSEKCSYTFIVAQRKVTGALCVSSREPREA